MPEINSTNIPHCEQCNHLICARPENYQTKRRNFRFCAKKCHYEFFRKYLGWLNIPKKTAYDYPSKRTLVILICGNRYCRKEYTGSWWGQGNFCSRRCRWNFNARHYEKV